ncbi:SLATT domain-containing protein [Wenjunlia tyrosinilytica]|uniref:SMODS and SLOG-associating 2TM effector domain-containing protein n=1 Tax=Wenjunlia tyrosinilytica TaxID=1544741 RepID=A0A917ZLF0_9ACTN|nr:SLATT domain-containing protein [Wenjunlia tyrosinilytica]GGO85053.1 hypothetical protein GCM10012280_17950 [Wenjunlia tyrosinilytica]
MSQPDMQPEQAPRHEGVPRGAVPRGGGSPEGVFHEGVFHEGVFHRGVSQEGVPREGVSREGVPECTGRRGRAGDLRARPFPLGDWGEPAERLDELYLWAERRALSTVDWYLRDREWKRRGARATRPAAVVLTAVGAVLALLDHGSGLGGPAQWGCAALLAAAACLGLDRCFGLTSGWMRDVGTAQAVRRRLEAFQFDWASESVREVLGPTEGTASEAAERCLTVLRRFCEDVSELERAETTEWMLEFRSSMAHTRTQGPVAWEAARVVEPGPPPTRIQLPPGSRPSMPRQRPPEMPR